MTKTLRDYVTFVCRAQTYGSDLTAGRLAKDIKAEFKLSDDEADALSTFAMVYSCTDDVLFNFDGKERSALVEFKRLWDALGEKPSIKQIEAVRRGLPYALMTAWITAFNEEQRLFDVPVEQKPDSQLSDYEREQMKDPNSFLAEPTAAGK